jgi:hypothetical protein
MNDEHDRNDVENLGIETPIPPEPGLGEGPLVSLVGTAVRPAEEKVATKTGKTFVTGSVRVNGARGEMPAFWSLVGFSPAVQRQMLAIPDHSLVVVTGALGMSTWERRDGTSEMQMRVTVRSIERLTVTRVSAQREDSADRLTGDDGGERPFAPLDEAGAPWSRQ